MKDVIDIVKGIVQGIDTTIDGVYDMNESKYLTCDTKWARKGKYVYDSQDNKFLIDDVEKDESITATDQGANEDLDGVVTLPQPYFISGTKLAVSTEWDKVESDLRKKTPLIWLLENVEETIYGDQSSLERDMNLRLFFLDETNMSQFYTHQHREEVVKPMEALASAFMKSVNNDPMFKNVERYTRKTYSRFGVESNKGILENVLNAELSGLEVSVTISKFKENCKC